MMRTIVSKYKLFLASIFLVFITTAVRAQDAAGTTTPKGLSNETFLLIIIGILLFILLIMAMILRQMSHVVKEVKKGPGYVKRESGFMAWWSNLDKKIFTKAVPVEKEADVMLDHDYDGIKELDNALPPWWKWGFYFTLVLAVIYLLRFHVWKSGPTPEEEYNREMTYAAKQMENYLKKAGAQVDEKTVTLADAAGVEDGKKRFLQTCSVCHGNKGEGGVGPNLTDAYWLHGGAINDIFKTIKYGVPDKGMQSWEKAFSPEQIKNLSSYIKSIGGTNPPNPKAPQGNLFSETPAADSSSVKTDSVTVN